MSGPEEAGPGGGVARVPEVERRQLGVEAEGGEVDGAEEDEDEGEQVGEDGEAVVERVAGRQRVAGPQLVQHEVHPALVLETKVIRMFPKISRRRPLQGPSPGLKRLLALSHLRHY